MSLFLLSLLACGEVEPPPSVPAKSMEPAPEIEVPSATPSATSSVDSKLLDVASATAIAPDNYKVQFETSQGSFVVAVDRNLAPKGADRFYNLVKIGYFDDLRFFRVIPGFMVQFGIHGQPEVNKVWKDATIQDDAVKATNSRGMVSFATAGKDTRTTQVFINFGNNANLDGMGFSPFGQVESGMEVVDKLYSGYGEGAPRGKGPWQHRIQDEGNAYLDADFPKMDRILTARLVD